jgi:hypothetical protein
MAIVGHVIEVEFDSFGWEQLQAESTRQGVSVEDVVRHAALYFLAERDEDRMDSRVSPFPRHTAPRDEHVGPGDTTAYSKRADC